MGSETTANPTPQFLNAPGDVYQPSAGPAVTRYPLVYTPSSATQINYSRLPHDGELAGMDLAYREQLLTHDQIAERTGQLALIVILTGSIGMLATILIGPYLPMSWIFLGGVLFGTGAAGMSVLRGRRLSINTLGKGVFGPTLIALTLPSLGYLAQVREIGAVVFGVVTAVLFLGFGRHPFDFYQGWLSAHPRLRPTTRAAIQMKRLRPNYGLLIACLLLVVFGPITSHLVTLGLLAIPAFALGASPTVIRKAYRVLGQYITYGERTTSAPGVWRPVESLSRRRRTVLALTLSFYLTLASGLSLFVPVDVVKERYPQSADTPTWNFVEAVFTGQAAKFQPMIGDAPDLIFIPSLSVLYSMLVPTFLLFAIFRPAVLKADQLHLEIEGDTDSNGAVSGGLDNDGRTEWQWYVDRLNTSPHRAMDPLDPFGVPVCEAEHLFLGVEPNFKFPVLLDRRILSEHCYIVGETGSGKTALGIMPLALQLLRGSTPRDPQTSSPRPAIVILDLKGDPALFHTFREECGDRIPFRFFTPQPGRPTHFFNAFRELHSENRSFIQLAQLILDSLSLSHGEGYGRSYYSRQSRFALLSVLKKNPNMKSFGELYAALDAEKRNRKEAFELVSTIHALTFYPQLITSPGTDVPPEHVIHMPAVIDEGQVAYFWLPAALESASVREIGKLALYALLTAAIDRQHEGKPKRQTYVVIDEFQRLVGDNFRIILEQARSFGLSAILANQTQGDLVTADSDLRPTIRTNTRLKLFFSLTDPADVKTLIESSGEEVAVMRGWSDSGDNASVAWTETLKPRLTRNDVLAASDHPLEFIAHVSRGSGYTQFGGLPIPVRTSYPISAELYRARGARAWPELTPGLAVSETSVENIEQRRSEEAEAALAQQKAKLEELLKRKAPPK